MFFSSRSIWQVPQNPQYIMIQQSLIKEPCKNEIEHVKIWQHFILGPASIGPITSPECLVNWCSRSHLVIVRPLSLYCRSIQIFLDHPLALIIRNDNHNLVRLISLLEQKPFRELWSAERLNDPSSEPFRGKTFRANETSLHKNLPECCVYRGS